MVLLNRNLLFLEFQGSLQYKQKPWEAASFVVQGLKINLLGIPAITELNIALYDATTNYDSLVKNKFPTVFQGLRNLGEPYAIQLKKHATPYGFYSAQYFLILLYSNVQEELARIETKGIISKVDMPTQWCTSIIAVPENSGTVCICVDLKRLIRVSCMRYTNWLRLTKL